MHNKILTLFNYNLESDFLKSILEEEAEVNAKGSVTINFTKKFNDKTYRIFESISVCDYGQFCNIILNSGNFSIWKLYRFKKLINDLHKIYGQYENNLKYSINDFRKLKDKKKEFCTIRTWPGIEKELLPCDIYLDRTTNKLQLKIFGANIDPEIKYIW